MGDLSSINTDKALIPADEKNWRSLVNVMCITLKPRLRTAGYVRNNNKKKENVSIYKKNKLCIMPSPILSTLILIPG